MSRFGIIGGGFGLYGYLPAVAARSSAPIATLAGYREELERRPELTAHAGRMEYHPTVQAVFARSEIVVIARRPADQESLVTEMIDGGWRGMLILEKPMAPTPERSGRLLERLIAARIPFRVGFLFPGTDWFFRWREQLQVCTGSPARATIDWRFQANHYAQARATWKRRRAEGGGALRFYGIHLLASLAALGDWNVFSAHGAADEEEEPRFRFVVGNGSLTINVGIATDIPGPRRFRIRLESAALGSGSWRLEQADPLVDLRQGLPEVNESGRPDSRIGGLGQLIGSLSEDHVAWEAFYRRHLALWREVEARQQPMLDDPLA